MTVMHTLTVGTEPACHCKQSRDDVSIFIRYDNTPVHADGMHAAIRLQLISQGRNTDKMF